MSMPITFEEFVEVVKENKYPIYPLDTVTVRSVWNEWCCVRYGSTGCLTTRFNEYFENKYAK